MKIEEWYLKLKETPMLSEESNEYIESIKPHSAEQWDIKATEMAEYKKELLIELRRIQGNRCVYCGLSLERRLVDREHFVPKRAAGKHGEFVFHKKNLFAACAFCNRKLKGKKSTLIKFDPVFEKCDFSIVHPVLDTPSTEIDFYDDDEGNNILVRKKTEKGLKTIKMFDLDSADMTVARAGFIGEVRMREKLAANAPVVQRVSGYKPSY